jgi:very-short-patch-repair endonuclease
VPTGDSFINFKEAYPQLIKYWDYEKNTTKIEDAHAGSKLKYFFLCENNHSFEKTPVLFRRSPTKALNCPECIGLSNTKYLFKEKPFLLKFWDKDKNIKSHAEITTGYTSEIFLICSKGHSFTRYPKNLSIINKLRCKICSGKEVVKDNRLDSNYPDLIKEWDYEKNKNLLPSQTAFNSNKKVHWKCSENHEWEQGISDRTGTRYQNKDSTKCPYCYQNSRSRNELIIFSELHQFFKSVKSTYKIHGKEIDIFIEDLNLGIEYDGEYWHRNKKEKDLEKNRVCKKNGIPILRVRENPLPKLADIDFIYDCSSNLFDAIKWILNYILNTYKLDQTIVTKINNYLDKSKVTNDHFLKKIIDKYKIMKITNQKLYLEYSTENSLPLHYYGAGSAYKATWNCSKCDHQWKATIHSRCGSGTGCSNCFSIKNHIKKKDSIGYLYPLLQKEILSSVDLLTISPKNNTTLIKWKCSQCKNQWNTYPFIRLKESNRCRICGFHILFQENFLTEAPHLKDEWAKENKILNPLFLSINYQYKVFWKCENGHTTREKIKHKLDKNRSCKECSKTMYVADLILLEKDWDYTKNIGLDPKTIKAGSKKKAWWKCSVSDDHQWNTSIKNRINNECPFCKNKEGFLSATNRLDIVYPKIAKEWNFKLNEGKPSDYTYRSRRSKDWICSECDHLFKSSISQRIKTKGFCPECRCRHD